MARKRKKNLTTEEELVELEREVTECEDKIQKLTERKKELEQLIEQKKMEALHQAMVEAGKSMEEVMSLIRENKEQEG